MLISSLSLHVVQTEAYAELHRRSVAVDRALRRVQELGLPAVTPRPSRHLVITPHCGVCRSSASRQLHPPHLSSPCYPPPPLRRVQELGLPAAQLASVLDALEEERERIRSSVPVSSQ